MFEDDPVAFGFQALLGLGNPSHEAARLGNKDGVQCLLDHDADIDKYDSLGRLPEDVVKLYVQHEVCQALCSIRTARASSGRKRYA